jgi:hypothetical protein
MMSTSAVCTSLERVSGLYPPKITVVAVTTGTVVGGEEMVPVGTELGGGRGGRGGGEIFEG